MDYYHLLFAIRQRICHTRRSCISSVHVVWRSSSDRLAFCERLDISVYNSVFRINLVNLKRDNTFLVVFVTCELVCTNKHSLHVFQRLDSTYPEWETQINFRYDCFKIPHFLLNRRGINNISPVRHVTIVQREKVHGKFSRGDLPLSGARSHFRF
jgi:hypothetical protein